MGVITVTSPTFAGLSAAASKPTSIGSYAATATVRSVDGSANNLYFAVRSGATTAWHQIALTGEDTGAITSFGTADSTSISGWNIYTIACVVLEPNPAVIDHHPGNAPRRPPKLNYPKSYKLGIDDVTARLRVNKECLRSISKNRIDDMVHITYPPRMSPRRTTPSGKQYRRINQIHFTRAITTRSVVQHGILIEPIIP